MLFRLFPLGKEKSFSYVSKMADMIKEKGSLQGKSLSFEMTSWFNFELSWTISVDEYKKEKMGIPGRNEYVSNFATHLCLLLETP